MKALVIGAGITGVTTAYYLAQADYDVTICDERKYPAMATSYANGGQLSASNAETWNSWRNIKKGIKWLTQPDAPLKINLTPDLDKYSWFVKFMLEIKNREVNTIETCRMALEAHKLYKDIADKEGIKFDKIEKGILHVYTTDEEFNLAKKTNDLYRRAGLDRWEVSPQEINKIEPALSNPYIIGGYYNTSDFTGDIHKFCIELTKVLEKKYGVVFTNKPVNRLDYNGPVVVCAGVGSRKLANTIEDDLPIYPVKGYSITINNPGNAPWVSLLDDEAKIVTARLGKNRLRVAGTAEFNGYNTDIVQARIRPLIRWSERMFQGINTEDIKPWAGLRPMTPSMMPIVKQSKTRSNVWYNTGHGHLGWTLSAYTAQTIVEKIRGYNGPFFSYR
jgi:D-amino-acid dehydrogenase